MFNQGQMGNQLFSYTFACRLRRKKDEVIVSANLNEANELVNLVNTKVIRNKIFKRVYYRLGFVFSFLAKCKLISSVYVTKGKVNGYEVELGDYSISKGVLPVTYIAPCIAQNKALLRDEDIDALEVKSEHISSARDFIKDNCGNEDFIAIHIRRSDYVLHRVYGIENVTLPNDYYIDQIEKIRLQKPNLYLVFLTDDLEFVKSNFGHIKNSCVSDCNMYTDFAIISKSNNSIISPSTFSWWAIIKNKNNGINVAPKYWLGWQSKLDYPLGIDLSSFTLEEVGNEH